MYMYDPEIQQLTQRIDALEASQRNLLNFNTKLDARLIGPAVNRTVNSVYQAITNVIVYYFCTNSGSGTVVLSFKTDAANPPTTVVWKGSYDTSHGSDSFSMTYFVPKGNFYKMFDTSGGTASVVYQEVSLSKYSN